MLAPVSTFSTKTDHINDHEQNVQNVEIDMGHLDRKWNYHVHHESISLRHCTFKDNILLKSQHVS